MRYVEAAGLRSSVIGLGTWQFGSREWGYGDAYASDVAPALVRRALELGITFFDSAEVYGLGRSERILGNALNGRRDGAVVATKLMPLLPIPSITVRRGHASRGRLGIDAIDLYQLHWPNPLVPPRTTMQGMSRLLRAGVIRAVGVSNYSLARWRVGERALGQPVVSNQVRFSLANPAPAWDMVPWAAANDRLLIAYSPLGQGLLARDGTEPAGSSGRMARFGNRLAGQDGRGQATQVVGLLREIARGHGATQAQVALAWVIAHPNVIAIPGARTLEQLEENAGAADLVLGEAEVTALTRAADRLDTALRA